MDQVLKILVIDQDANNAGNIVRTVKSSGFAIRETIVSSKEQFEEINQQPRPHIIIQSTNIDELSLQNLQLKADNCRELDQRCHKIPDTSHDVICCIHEGLHTYVNASYLELFAINDPEDASVLSILELVIAKD